MEFTGKQFQEMSNSLGNLITSKLDAYTTFRIRKFAKAVLDELKAKEEARTALVEKYGVELAPGQKQVMPDRLQEFNDEWEKIVAEPVILPNVTIKIRELERAGLSVMDIVNLDPFLDQDDDSTMTKVIPLHEVTKAK